MDSKYIYLHYKDNIYTKEYNNKSNNKSLTLKDIVIDIVIDIFIDITEPLTDPLTESHHLITKDDLYILDNYYFIIDNKLVFQDDIIIHNNEDLSLQSSLKNRNIHIKCIYRQKGGNDINQTIDKTMDSVAEDIDDTLDKVDTVLDSVLTFFTSFIDIIFAPIYKPLETIGNICKIIIKFIFWLTKFTIWFIAFIIWFLFDLLNPIALFNDFYTSIMIIVVSLCKLPFDILYKLFSMSMIAISSMIQGFWGWDQSSLTKNDKNSNYFKSFDRTKGSKCYLSNSNTVPFSIILGTILCPPMGVFMDMGLSGWINILICCLLTLAYYIPGLVYALLIIYS